MKRRLIFGLILISGLAGFFGSSIRPGLRSEAVGADRLRAEFTSPPIKDFGLKEYVHLSKDLPHSETRPWKLVGTMPYNCHFQPWIQLEAPAGEVIRLNSSNPLVLYLTPTETYTTVSGEQIYEAKNWVSGEGAIYTIPAGVTV